jgi:hypothetical protein
MEANNSSSPGAQIIPILILVAALIGLYYLYQYLFGPKTNNSYPLITKKQDAHVDPAITIGSDKLPPLFEGGEFTVSTWIYIGDWSYQGGYYKHLLSIGGASFQTITIYLGARKPQLAVRLHYASDQYLGAAATKDPSVGSSSDQKSFFRPTNQAPMDSGLLDGQPMCDLPEIDLQRWVNLTVAVNGRTVDVYLDGKLSRSCVLPAPFNVDSNGYSAKLLNYGGFGGKISSTTMYDSALNPEMVYKNYMAGPEPITSFTDWISSFFAPGVSISVSSN